MTRVAVALAAVSLVTCSESPGRDTTQPGAESVAETDVSDSRPKNVLLLVIDTLRADRCSFVRPGQATTPRLEAFAAECANFANAWVPAGWTGPSHASLFTGLRPANHGFIETRLTFLPPSQVTLAERLQSAGYRTAAYSNNLVVGADFGLVQGYAHAPPIALEKTRPRPLCRDAHARALEFMRTARDAGKPFHVYVNDFEPHLPFEPPPEIATRFVPAGTPPSTVAEARAWNNPDVIAEMLGLAKTRDEILTLVPRLYEAEIALVDQEVGDFLETLRAEGFLDDTLVVITSDHGENLGEHGLWDHRFSLHRTIRHVPLLMRFPDGAQAGVRIDDVVRTEDVLPTVLDFCALPVPEGLDGQSLMGPTAGRIARATYAPQHSNRPNFEALYPDAKLAAFDWSIRAVTDGRHHLIVRSDGLVELYDLVSDPDETRNIADDDPATVERLRAQLDP